VNKVEVKMILHALETQWRLQHYSITFGNFYNM